MDELKYEVQPVDVDALVQNNEGNMTGCSVGGGQGDKDEMGLLGWGEVWGGVADSGFLRCHIKWQTHLEDFFLFASLDIVLSIFFLFGRRGSKNKCSNLATQFV